MILSLNNVKKIIHGATVVDDISAEFESGTVYGLSGYNGSGKTMLMRLVAGLIRPSTGTVTIDGKQLCKDLDFPPSLGMLIENPAFLNPYTGIQNLRLLAGIKNIINDDQIVQALEAVGLNPTDKRRYRKYSLGMKQRLGVAAAIMEQPDILILDEPTNALDPDGVLKIIEIVMQERERGAIIILSCHDHDTLTAMSDYIYTIENGRITDVQTNMRNVNEKEN